MTYEDFKVDEHEIRVKVGAGRLIVSVDGKDTEFTYQKNSGNNAWSLLVLAEDAVAEALGKGMRKRSQIAKWVWKQVPVLAIPGYESWEELDND